MTHSKLIGQSNQSFNTNIVFYIHTINPHDSAEHHDTICEGYWYGIWQHPTPAQSPYQYDVQSKTFKAAQDSANKLQRVFKDE